MIGRGTLGMLALLVLLPLALLGCPGVPVVIVVSTEVLNFGENTNTLSFTVSKSSSSNPISSIRAVPSDPWIRLSDCTTENDPSCRSQTVLDIVTIRVTVDRDEIDVGDNTGTITLLADGAAVAEVEVRVSARAVADFSADDRVIFENDAVTFMDESSVLPGAQEIVAWRWNFGDGSPVSTRQNPLPHVYTGAGEFTVTLTITVREQGNERQIVARKENFVVVLVRKPPAIDFTASNLTPPINIPVQFENTTVPGSFPIVGFSWSFGDNQPGSTEENPRHTYLSPGTFDVTLTVTVDDGNFTTFTRTKEDFIQAVLVEPVPDFEILDDPVLANRDVTLVDRTTVGSGFIIRRDWAVDGEDISPATNAIEVVTQFPVVRPGTRTFDVSLTVTDQFGQMATVTKEVDVSTLPPVADFERGSTHRPNTAVDTQFNDTTDLGTGVTVLREWNFGDGTPIVNQRDPAHRYEQPGTYTVTLSVTTEHGQDTVVKEAFVEVFEGTELDAYVAAPDSTFRFDLIESIESPVVGLDVTLHVLNLISQTWRPNDIAPTRDPRWEHTLRVLEPDDVEHDTVMLVIGGGDNFVPLPGFDDTAQGLAALAQSTGSVVALLEQVPNQPLPFVDENNPRFIGTEGRSEDEIIAFTFQQFLAAGKGVPGEEDSWPLLSPMVKSAVRAMDALEDFLLGRNLEVEDFIVSGASKRGWTTWLTAAVDERVRGISPLVFDSLNMQAQLEHQLDVYGFFAEAVQDYVEAGVFSEFVTQGAETELSPQAQRLLDIVDPYEYRERLAMPKFLVNSTGDQFFLPDSGQFYLDDLLGETKVAYLPNTDHSLGGVDVALAVIQGWYNTVLNRGPLPQFTWEVQSEGRILVTPSNTPRSASLWVASNEVRDFRLDDDVNPDPPEWVEVPLAPGPGGTFSGVVSTVGTNFNAFFVSLDYAAGSTFPENRFPYFFTTEVRIAPDVFMPETPVLPMADFSVATLNPAPNQPVQFTDQSDGLIRPIFLRVWDFGDPASDEDNISTATNPTHTYSAPGVYNVSLTVTTVHGSDTHSMLVPVQNK